MERLKRRATVRQGRMRAERKQTSHATPSPELQTTPPSQNANHTAMSAAGMSHMKHMLTLKKNTRHHHTVELKIKNSTKFSS